MNNKKRRGLRAGKAEDLGSLIYEFLVNLNYSRENEKLINF
jgi:hypothetical protein